MQFWWRFHKPQPAIVLDNRRHAARKRKDEFRAGKAVQRHAEVRALEYKNCDLHRERPVACLELFAPLHKGKPRCGSRPGIA